MTIRRSLAWVAAGQAGFFVLQFAGSVVVARLLNPYDMGIFAVAMAAIGVISIIQAVGLSNFLIREAELHPDVVATAGTVNLVIVLVMAAIIAGLGLLGGALFDEPGVRDVLLVLAVVPIIGHIAFVPNAMLEREGSFRTLTLIKMGSTAVGLAITIGLAADGYRYMSLAYSQLATAVLTNVVVILIARRHLNLRLSLSHWSRIAKFGFQIMAISGLSRIAARLNEIALGRIVGLAALGLYSRASTNYYMLSDNIHGVITRVVFVDLSREARQGGALRERYLKILELVTGLLWPVFAGVAVVAGPFTVLVYGEQWAGAALPLSLLCIAGVLLVSVSMVWEVFVICDETGRQARFEFIRAIVGAAMFVAACFHSLEAAAATRIADGVFAHFLYRPHLQRMIRTRPGDFRRIYRRSGLGMVAAIAPALAVMAMHGFSPRTPVIELAVAVGLGGVLWLLAIRQLQHQLYGELQRLFGRLRRSEVPA